jgi:hypothetical protein
VKSSHSLDRLDVAFDDHRLTANAGLLLPATLGQHLGLEELFDEHVDLGGHHAGANVGRKAMTLVASALVGGDCIEDADALRAGGTGDVLGHRVAAPSTLGTFMRAFIWGHARQMDVAMGEALKRAWAAGAGPGDQPLTMDLTPRSVRRTGCSRQAGPSSRTTTSAATTRSSPLFRAPVTSATRGCAAAPRTPVAAPRVSCGRRFSAFVELVLEDR